MKFWPLIVCCTGVTCLAVPRASIAQTAPAPSPSKTWSGGVSLATYFFPDDDDVLQPTVYVDRKALHIETRYNYEDTNSTSLFAGWNFEFGKTVTFAVTPIAGFVAGNTDGGIIGTKADITWRFLEAYTEAEYVMPSDDQHNFFYNWSEFSVWPTEWLRAGAVIQRTRTFRRFRDQKDIEPGVLLGLSGSIFEGTFYFFNPGSDDKYFVASFGVSF